MILALSTLFTGCVARIGFDSRGGTSSACEVVCDPHAACAVVNDSVTCTCLVGWNGDGSTCEHGGGVSVDAASSVAETAVDSASWSHFSDNDELLIVAGVFSPPSVVVTELTYGGSPLSRAGGFQGAMGVGFWILTTDEGLVIGEDVVSLQLDGPADVAFGAISVSGVDPVNMFGTARLLSNSNTVEYTVPGTPGDFVFDIVGDHGCGDLALEGSQTLLWRRSPRTEPCIDNLLGASSASVGQPGTEVKWTGRELGLASQVFRQAP